MAIIIYSDFKVIVAFLKNAEEIMLFVLAVSGYHRNNNHTVQPNLACGLSIVFQYRLWCKFRKAQLFSKLIILYRK